MKIKGWKSLSTIASLTKCINLLTDLEKKKTLAIVFVQVALGILDLTGVALIGILASLTLSGIDGRQPGDRVSGFLRAVNLDSYTFQQQALFLAMLATTLLVGRTYISVLFTKKILHFLSRRGSQISGNAMSKLMSRSIQEIQVRSVQESIYLLTVGVVVVSLGILGTLTILASDLILLGIMMTGLFVIDPLIALSSLILFSFIGAALYFLLSNRAKELGELNSKLSVMNSQQIQNAIYSYREMFVKDRRSYFVNNFRQSRDELASVLAEVQFLPNISKYVIESSVVVTSTVICAIQFAVSDAYQAIATLSVFLAAGTRITPALMRIQQSAIQLKGSLATADPTLNFLEELSKVESGLHESKKLDANHEGFMPVVKLDSVNFKYPDSNVCILKDFSLDIRVGEKIAFVGVSGVGKSSVIDLILGLLKPDSGEISISGVAPEYAISKWPGSVSYVPQEIYIIPGTLRENILLGYNNNEISETLFDLAVTKSQLTDLTMSLSNGIDTELKENGRNLSGGQKQRIGIARAFITSPKLLLLDEATSALDGQTEYDISQSISGLGDQVTVISIAHRLSTIMNYDRIIFLSGNGEHLIGNFENLREISAEFDSQAKMMGL
jgi:ABC-type multidrug transport system fused ATPase/permease subunit